MSSEFLRKSQKFTFYTFIFLAIILIGIIAAYVALQNTLQTKSKAQETNSDTPPFRGCVAGVSGNEWLCMCRLPSGEWWTECSIIEDTVGKQKYIDQCGGDKEKAFMQWKYDVALSETGGQCSCGGQNVCGSLVRDPKAPPKSFPTPETPIWPTQLPVVTAVIPTLIPTPTLAYQVPTRSLDPTGIYLPPTNVPIIFPTSINQQPTLVPTKTIISIPQIKINFAGVNKFFADTKKSIAEFLAHVLP